jgi:phosphatidylglycerol:prolipoprotein diacylglycerol transferase
VLYCFCWSDVYPLLHIGLLRVVSYSALLGLGLIGGAAIVYLVARRRELDAACALDVALAAALGGLLGARAAHVALNWAYYGDHLGQAFDLWGGGHFWHGGLVGGLAAVLIYVAVRRTSPWPWLDALAPGVALFAVCAWLGCLLDTCAYGVETHPGQGLLWALSLESPDIYGIWAPRVAMQPIGALWAAAVLGAVFFAERSMRLEGFLFPLWLALYCAGSFGLGFLRADVVPVVAGWRLDRVVDLALCAIGAVTLVVGLLRGRKVAR